ncbi:MAG: hypothetical protein ACRD2F_07050, partial [Terriglobales bacterium]
AADFPDLAPGCSHASLLTSGPIGDRLNHYFNSSCFVAPPVVTADGATGFGNLGPSVARGPAEQDFDIALIKNLPLGEGRHLQIRGEFYNAFNTPSFSDPESNLGTVQGSATGASTLSLGNTFGTITSTSVNPRIIQLAVKFLF